MYIVYENKCLFQVDFATLTQSQFWKRNRSGSVFVSSFQGKTNTEIEYYCVSTVPWHREGPIFCYYIKPFCHHNNDLLILISVNVIGYEDPLLQHSIHILFSKMVSFNKLKIAFCMLKEAYTFNVICHNVNLQLQKRRPKILFHD